MFGNGCYERTGRSKDNVQPEKTLLATLPRQGIKHR